jgi:hypothetical protein
MLLVVAHVMNPLALMSDTLILSSGRKVSGDILRVSRRSVVIQVDDFLQLTFYRAHVREMRTNTVSKFGSDPNAIAFIYDPDAEGNKLPQPEEIDPKKFKIPSPVIVNRPDFRPTSNQGGDSDGKMIGVDGRPLAAHKIYAVDSEYFARKIRSGIIRTTPPEDSARMSALRYLAKEVSTVRHLQNDLKSGIMLESRDRTRTTLLDTHDSFKKESAKYVRQYEKNPLAAPEYALAYLVARLTSATRTYTLCETMINYEERVRSNQHVDLDVAKSERGRKIRLRMRSAIMEMAQVRATLLKKYGYFYKVGVLPGESSQPKRQVWKIAHNEALLFPFQTIEGTVAHAGLLEDYQTRPITAAKPLIVKTGQTVEVLQRKTSTYPAGNGGVAVEFEVVEVRIAKGEAQSYSNRRALPPTELRGWMVADRIDLLSE